MTPSRRRARKATIVPDAIRGTAPSASAAFSLQVVAGYAVEYETPGADWPFYFVTVKGAGHMVPQYKPAFALTFFEKLLAFDF